MGTPAWQKREYERQEFIRNLNRMVDDAYEALDEETNESEAYGFMVKLLHLALDFFDDRHSEYSFDTLVEQPSDSEISKKAYHVWQELLEATSKFARSETERDDILATFFERELTPGLMAPFHAKALRERMEAPERVLHASSSTEEVEL